MRKILALALALIAPAVEAAPLFGTHGGVGSSTSTYSAGEPAGGTFSINGLTGKAAFGALNLAPGVPSAPANGDIWTTATGAYGQAGGLVNGPFATRNDINVFDYMTLAQRADVAACGLAIDDTASIQAAVNAVVGTTTGRVILPNGCYHTTASINLNQNVELVGSSERGVKLFPNGNFPAIQALGTYANGLGGIGVRNMSIICAGMSNTSAMGVKFVYVNRGILKDLYFNGCYHALDLYDQWQTVIDNATADGVGSAQNNVGTYLGAPTDSTNPGPNNAVIMSNSMMQNVSTYGYRLVFFAGSKFINDEATNGVTGWKLCGAAYVISGQACQFGHFVNIISDTTSAASIDIQQGSNAQPINNVMFDHVWMGNSAMYGLYLSGLTYSQFDNLHVTAADYGVALRNSTNVKISANIAQYNRNNTSAQAVLIDNSSSSTIWATNSQSAYPLGYNGIEEVNGAFGNSIWGGVATCSAGLSFGGSSTGMTFGTSDCEYEVTGRQVRVQYYLGLSAKGSATGAAAITGLPFPVQATSASSASGSVQPAVALSGFSGLTAPILAQSAAGGVTAGLVTQGATGTINLTDAAFTDSSVLTGSISYVKQ